MAFEQFTSEHPYLTFFLGVAAIHGIVTVIRGRDPLVLPADIFGRPLPPPPPHPLAPPAPPGMHPALAHAAGYAVGAPPPGSDYSFTRRPGFNDKNY